MVTQFEVRGGSPPVPAIYLKRMHLIGWTDRLGSDLEAWERWFEQIEESHTSQPSLALFRSQRSTRRSTNWPQPAYLSRPIGNRHGEILPDGE